MIEISRKKAVRPKDPDTYIKRLFGKDFEFSEKFLTSKIDPNKVIKAIKKRYKFKKVTKTTLKHVLYEGARSNNILRINDDCFTKMVDILNIPLDEEEADKTVMRYISSNSIIATPNATGGAHRESFHLPSIVKVPRKTLNMATVKRRLTQTKLNLNGDSEESDKDADENDKKQTTINSIEFIQNTYSDIFNSTVEILRKIIQIETDHIEEHKMVSGLKMTKPKNSSVLPDRMMPAIRDDYMKLKREYRRKLDILLSVRSWFSKKMMVDIILTTMNTVEDTKPEENDWTRAYSIKDISSEGGAQSRWIDFRRDYTFKFMLITISTLITFAIYGYAATFAD